MGLIDAKGRSARIISVLHAAGRPLSVRRLQRMLDELPEFESPTEDEILSALRIGCEEGGVAEIRHGVFQGKPHLSSPTQQSHNESQGGRAGRRRRSRMARASEGLPSAPLSLDETAALSVQAGSPQQLRQAMWMRMRRKAIEVAGVIDADADAAPDPTDASPISPHSSSHVAEEPIGGLGALIREAVSSGSQPRLRVVSKSRPLLDEDEADGDHHGAESSSDDWRDDALQQVRFPSDLGVDEDLTRPTTLEGAASLVVGGQAPYRDRRSEEMGPPDEERRHHDAGPMPSRASVAECARVVLIDAAEPMTVAKLDAIVTNEIGVDGGALTSRLLSDNETRLNAGERPYFVIGSDGRIGLTRWGVPSRYITHETRLKGAGAEIDELVKRAVLKRVSEQPHRVFHRLMVLLLERLGFKALREVSMSAAGQLAFVGRRESGVDREETAVFAVNGWRRIDGETVRIVEENLSHFGAKSGLVITVGTFTQAAVEAANDEEAKSVRLVDGAALAGLLFSHGLGVQSYRVKVPYIDGGFFSALEQ